MKSNYLIQSSLVLLVLTLFMACSEEEVQDAAIIAPDTLTAEGYIAGYHPCATRAPYNIGEGLLIITEQDSMLTFNFPDSIFNFPEEIFLLQSFIFPQDYRDQYKIRFTFRKAADDELRSPLCNPSMIVFGIEEYEKNQVVIVEAESI